MSTQKISLYGLPIVLALACIVMPASLYAENVSGQSADTNGAPQASAVIERQLAHRRAQQAELHPQWRDLTWSQQLERFTVFASQFAARWLRALAVSSAATEQTAAGFQGNLTFIIAPSGQAMALHRESDCSLTLRTGSFTLSLTNPNAQVLSETTRYEGVLHTAAGLSTTGGIFNGGCAEPTIGIGSRRAVYLGKSSQNLHVGAGSGYNYMADSNALYSGTVDATALTVHAVNTPDTSLSGLWALAAGDLNGDGLADIAGVEYYDAAAINVWLFNADGTPGTPTRYNLSGAGDRTTAAVTADVDGDGKLDVVVASRASSNSQEYISVLRGNGNGTLNGAQSMTVPSAPGTSWQPQIVNLIAADLRGNGRPDIVASNGLTLLNSGTGSFTVGAWAFPANSSTSSYGPNLAAADFNHDGKLDVAVNNGVSIALFTGGGDGTFVAGKAYVSSNENVGYLTATDLDGDGNVDLYVGLANGGVFGGDQFAVGEGYALMGNGDGSFHGAPLQSFSYTGTNITDLNGDGKIDAVGVNSDLSFTTYLGDGQGGFAAASTRATSPITLSGSSYTLSDIDSYALGDVNGDGKRDLLYFGKDFYGPPYSNPGVFIALGDGQGLFAAPSFYPAPSFAPSGDFDYDLELSNLRLADVNGDGRADLLYSYSDQFFNAGTYIVGTAVQLSNGDGTFQAPQKLSFYSAQSSTFRSSDVVQIADVNKDGKPDLLFLTESSTTHSILGSTYYMELALGNGDGSFGARTALAGPDLMGPMLYYTQYAPIVLADMDGDSALDIVALGSTNTGSIQIAISPGNGDGTFRTPILQNYSSQFFQNGLAVADFNRDGKLDVLVTGASGLRGNGISFGNGDGTLQPVNGSSVIPNQGLYLAASGPTLALDVNGDDKMDVQVGSTTLLGTTVSDTGGSANFTLQATSGTLSVAAGQSATTTLTVIPSGGFAQAVTFSCAGLPAGASCNFSPASVTPSSGTASTTLTVSTNGGAVATVASNGSTAPNASTGVLYAFASLLLLATGIVRGQPSIDVRRRMKWSGAFTLLILCTVAACGGGSSGSGSGGTSGGSGTPAGTSSITVTATSGTGSTAAISHSINLALTVTR